MAVLLPTTTGIPALRIVVALDGPKRRDIKLNVGDQINIEVVVYAKDGDAEPIGDLENFSFGFDPRGDNFLIPVNELFTVPADVRGRRSYTLRGEVSGVPITLAYGVILTECDPMGCYPGYWGTGYSDYGWRW